MHRFRHYYQRTSFRGRLLLLLVAVSLIQASVAAYTFFDLQAKPAKQRVQAQLNAAMRGVAPVLDQQIKEANELLQETIADQKLKKALISQRWDSVDELLQKHPERDRIYVTDSNSTVVAGTQPQGVLLNQAGTTSSRITRGPELVATVHSPIGIDNQWLRDHVTSYVPDEVEIFVSSESELVRSKDTAISNPPPALRSGLHDVKLGDENTISLVQPLLDGSVLVGAAFPKAKASEIARENISSLWGFITLLTVMMIGMSWFITRAVSDALRKFATIARALASGELNRRVPVTGKDEVAVLSQSFNEMAENLEERIESLVDARNSMRRQVELFGAALANATEVDDMLRAVCSLAMETSHATHARFWTVAEGRKFEHAANIGLRPDDTEPAQIELAVLAQGSSVRSRTAAPYWLVIPARSTEGEVIGILTLVNIKAEFSDDDVRISERIALQAAVALENARMHEQLKLYATRDGLTGLPNHRSLQDELTLRIAESYESGIPLGVCMLDIDNFKRVNDTYGHPTGDEAIKAIGRTLAAGISAPAMVGRYGGEEFVVILPGCDAQTSAAIADRLREDITRIEVPLGEGAVLRVTSSFGVANMDRQNAGTQIDNTELLRQADVALYNAKRSGKNRVEIGGPDTVVIEMSEQEKEKLAARERGDLAA